MEHQNIDSLAAKWLSGSCSPEEVDHLFQWAAQSKENRKYLSDFIHIYNLAAKHEDEFNTQHAWEKMENRIHSSRRKVIPLGQPLLRIAASIIILAGIVSLIYLFFDQKPDQITASISNQSETPARKTLPDGTEIVLSPGTSIKYTETSTERIAALEGTAYFSISPDEKAYLIQSDELIIRDIGTSFDVIDLDETIKVIVEEGLVEMSHSTNKILVNPGETGIYHRKTGKLTHQNNPEPNISSWRSRQFSFKSEDIKTVVDQLNKVYGDIFILEVRNYSECSVTVTFRDEDPENIANILAATLGLKVHEKKGQFILSGNNCNP